VGESDKERKKFLMGMVMGHNTIPFSDCCFHATSGLFIVFRVEAIVISSHPWQE
jgi:hypothetical protein